MAHGHLVVMGGISTVDPSVENDGRLDPRSPVLTIERYRYTKFKERGRLDQKLRKISEEDIKDRSKSDIFSKLIAISQTTWFILQCIARGQQKLTLTELELVTLALASLNAITYMFWWHKPLGVQVPIRIYFGTEAVENVDVKDADAEPETTVSYILSGFRNQVGLVLAEIWNEFREINYFLEYLLFFLITLPLFLIFLVFFFPPLPFALGVLFLLNILKTKPVTQQELDDSKLIAARIVLALRQLRYKFTSSIARISEEWIREFLNPQSASGFFVGWLFVIPTLFVFLLLTTILLLPSSSSSPSSSLLSLESSQPVPSFPIPYMSLHFTHQPLRVTSTLAWLSSHSLASSLAVSTALVGTLLTHLYSNSISGGHPLWQLPSSH